MPVPRLVQDWAVAKAVPKHHRWHEEPAALGPTADQALLKGTRFPPSGSVSSFLGTLLVVWGLSVSFPGCWWDTRVLSPALPLPRFTCQVVEELGLCCRRSEALVENCPCVKIK